jgi:uncharacterized membrane protein YhaH (DUF805 family)
MDLVNLLFSLKGRINRRKFWLGILILDLAVVGGTFLLDVTRSSEAYDNAARLFAIPVLWMLLALCTKRLHDFNKSAAWALVGVIVFPFFILVLGLLKGSEGDNRFGVSSQEDHIDLLNLLFSFKGRIKRSKFWLGILIVDLAGIGSTVLSLEAYDNAALLFTIPVLWMLLALCTKRLHDVNMSAWTLVGVIVFPFLIIILGLLKGSEGDNRFGVSSQGVPNSP